mgnify:CR=1 FL=1
MQVCPYKKRIYLLIIIILQMTFGYGLDRWVSGQIDGDWGTEHQMSAISYGGTNYLYYGMTATGNYSSAHYLFQVDGYYNRWNDVTSDANSLNSYIFNAANGGTDNILSTVISGKYYYFKLVDNGYATSNGAVLEFDSTPVSISHFDDSGSGGDNTPFDFESSSSLQFKIDCGTSQPPADQKFYVRYHFDADIDNGYTNFSNANIVGTTVTALDGLNYYVLITVSKPSNASTVTYYSMTTESNIALTNSNVDLATVYFDNNGGSNYSNSINGGSLSIADPIDLPSDFQISSIYPNPFNPETTIQYRLEVASDITIEIYDISGQLVETLINGFSMPGEHQIIWKPKDISSGIYMVQMTLGSQRFKKQITYLK